MRVERIEADAGPWRRDIARADGGHALQIGNGGFVDTGV
jgi:hypothetical protein